MSVRQTQRLVLESWNFREGELGYNTSKCALVIVNVVLHTIMSSGAMFIQKVSNNDKGKGYIAPVMLFKEPKPPITHTTINLPLKIPPSCSHAPNPHPDKRNLR
jgi:hypothetical protein